MNKVFVEYKVAAGMRGEHFQFMTRKMETARFELYEGADQPDLFVEIWEGLDDGEYLRFKDERLNDPQSSWHPLTGMVEGGAGKIHIWRFRKVK